MIHIFSTRTGAADTFQPFLQDWAGPMGPRIRLYLYENLMDWPAAKSGTYLFTDLERLTPAQLELVSQFAEQIAVALPQCVILNHPRRALRRLDLLRVLHQNGINQFNAYPARDVPPHARFPLFLRSERDHMGPCTHPLATRPAMMAALIRLLMRGMSSDELIATEYCETKDSNGVYHKYSAFRFGAKIFPAHIIFSDNWVTKDGATPNGALRDLEDHYLRDNPHEEWLRKIFDLAQIDYGRIDYGLLNGIPQVWEINTCPVILKARQELEELYPEELPVKEALAVTILAALEAMDSDAPAAEQRPQITFALGKVLGKS